VQIVTGVVASRSEYYVQPDLQLAGLPISDLLKNKKPFHWKSIPFSIQI